MSRLEFLSIDGKPFGFYFLKILIRGVDQQR